MRDSKFVKVKDYSTLVRDKETNAIISLDDVEYASHKRKTAIEKAKRDEIQELKTSIEEIKAMMAQLLKGIQ